MTGLCQCASGIYKIPSFFSLLFWLHSFCFLTKGTSYQGISNLLFWGKEITITAQPNFRHLPIQSFRFNSKNSVFRKYVSSHMLRTNESTRLVIKNGNFTSVLILTVYSLLASTFSVRHFHVHFLFFQNC